MEYMKYMDKYIFLIEKVSPNGTGFALSTAPFFVDSETDSTLTLQQIRDANFSYVVEPTERIYMKIYRLSKMHAIKYHKCTEQQVFNQVIRNLIAYYPNPIMDFQQLYNMKLIKEITYQVGYENLSDIVFKQTRVDDIPTGIKSGPPTNKIYLYNPRITIQKNVVW